MKTLKLFNAVVAKESTDVPFVSQEGFIIESNALWAKDRILGFFRQEKLGGNELNKTFHKSWTKIKNSSRVELLTHQILHYLSTYGSDFKDEVYIPDEISEVPDVKLIFKVIKALSKEEMIDKCLSLLKSGIALDEETINDALSILVDELQYTFTGEEGVRNKEAIIKIADLYGILPSDTMEFFRYVIYRATGQSLLIKNKEMIELIKDSNYNPCAQLQQFGLQKLATIFNRFKPLFLAFKPKCGSTINKISKLSKKYHRPLVSNPLGFVTSALLTKDNLHWLDNATPFALFKAISACYSRKNGQTSFVYRIRNGKSWVTTNEATNQLIAGNNFSFLQAYLRKRFSLEGKKIFLPADIKYALPTSEKMFVGNIPTGTRFYGTKLAVGIYWENSWGASDIDLSGINIGGKVGWNSLYNQGIDGLMYSGDLTDASHGAVEYLYANDGLQNPTLVQSNVFSGDDNCGYKVIVGRGDKISRNYMMNPNNLFAEAKSNSVQKQTILGIFLPLKSKQVFVLLNFGAGSLRVSGNSPHSFTAMEALYEQWNSPYSFNRLVSMLGAELVDDAEKADYDFTLDSLEKDSFVRLF